MAISLEVNAKNVDHINETTVDKFRANIIQASQLNSKRTPEQVASAISIITDNNIVRNDWFYCDSIIKAKAQADVVSSLLLCFAHE